MEVIFNKIRSRVEITYDPVFIWSSDYVITNNKNLHGLNRKLLTKLSTFKILDTVIIIQKNKTRYLIILFQIKQFAHISN